MCRRGENIYHRKDGRWEARFPIGKRENGTTKFKSVFGKTYNEAKARKCEVMADWMKEHPPEAAERGLLLFSLFATKWLEEEVLGTVKTSTWQTYENTLKNQLIPYFSGSCIDAITPAQVQEFLFSMEDKGLSASTRRSALGLLNSIMRYAQEEGVIHKNPCRKIKVTSNHSEQRVFSPEELKKIFESGDFLSIFTMYTGLRLGEVCALRWSDIDWDKKALMVRYTAQRVRRTGKSAVMVGEPKTKKSMRVIPLPDELIQLLKEWQKTHGENQFVFGNESKAADPRTVQRRFERLLQKVGIIGGHFHTLRHSFATRLIQLGTEIKTVSTLMGHSTIKTTMDFYVHSGMELMRAALEKLAASF